jgi:hypothetical protein
VFSSSWSVYGLRKVLLGKEILILSSNSGVNKRILISGIRLTYKVVTPDIKKNKIIFLKFLKYWSSSRDFNKLVIKAKMRANTYFWTFYFLCIYIYMKIQYDLFFRDLAVCMKTKHFFYVLTKTRYFNTRFASLQYKNTNQY